MGELEEQQHTELLQVIAIGDVVVAEHGAVAQELLNDTVGFGAQGVLERRWRSRAPRKISAFQSFCGHEKAANQAA